MVAARPPAGVDHVTSGPGRKPRLQRPKAFAARPGRARISRASARCCPWAAVMASSRVFPVVRFVVKGSLAGGAMYVAYDQGLLGNGSQGAEALKKARAALPPAIQEWTNYTGWELPSTPKFDFSVSESWNTGVQTTVSALSVAPTKIREYTQDGWKYMKDLIK